MFIAVSIQQKKNVPIIWYGILMDRHIAQIISFVCCATERMLMNKFRLNFIIFIAFGPMDNFIADEFGGFAVFLPPQKIYIYISFNILESAQWMKFCITLSGAMRARAIKAVSTTDIRCFTWKKKYIYTYIWLIYIGRGPPVVYIKLTITLPIRPIIVFFFFFSGLIFIFKFSRQSNITGGWKFQSFFFFFWLFYDFSISPNHATHQSPIMGSHLLIALKKFS